MCGISILKNLLQALLCPEIRKNNQFCPYFENKPNKGVVLDFWTRKVLCEQVNIVLCV